MLAFEASVDIDVKPLPQHTEALGEPLLEHADAFQASIIIEEERIPPGPSTGPPPEEPRSQREELVLIQF